MLVCDGVGLHQDLRQLVQAAGAIRLQRVEVEYHNHPHAVSVVNSVFHVDHVC